jgi:hypothetical protein
VGGTRIAMLVLLGFPQAEPLDPALATRDPHFLQCFNHRSKIGRQYMGALHSVGTPKSFRQFACARSGIYQAKQQLRAAMS